MHLLSKITKTNERWSNYGLYTRTPFWQWRKHKIFNVPMKIVFDAKINELVHNGVMFTRNYHYTTDYLKHLISIIKQYLILSIYGQNNFWNDQLSKHCQSNLGIYGCQDWSYIIKVYYIKIQGKKTIQEEKKHNSRGGILRLPRKIT